MKLYENAACIINVWGCAEILPSTALAAVALQDHMTRSLSLQDPFKKKKINHSLPAVAARSKKTNKAVGKAKESHDKKEYVLDPTPAPLTLGMFWIIATFVRL